MTRSYLTVKHDSDGTVHAVPLRYSIVGRLFDYKGATYVIRYSPPYWQCWQLGLKDSTITYGRMMHEAVARQFAEDGDDDRYDEASKQP